MNFLNKMERKFGRYAISNLSLYLVIGYALGCFIVLVNPNILFFLTLEPYYIVRGQIWRIFTWILIPQSISPFVIITLMFYYSIGSILEKTWGTFYYNLYLFMGMIFTVLSAFITYAVGGIQNGLFTNYYVLMSIFLAFAMTYPNMQVSLMFILPIRVKWLGIIDAVLLVSDFIDMSKIGDVAGRIMIVASLFNFIIFFLLTSRNLKRMSPKQVKRRHDYHKEIKKARPMSVAKHKCAICGKNSEEYPDAEFRFCSKCNGNYEYCQDHLFTHTHVK